MSSLLGTTLTSLPAFVRLLWRTIRLLWRAAPRHTTLLSMVLLIQGSVPAATLVLTQYTIDSMSRLGSQTRSLSLLQLTVLWGITLLLTTALTPINQILQGDLAEQLTAFVNLSLMEKAEQMHGLDLLDDPSFYDSLLLVQDGARNRPLNVVVMLTHTLKDSMALLGVLLVLQSLAWWVPGLILLGAVPHARRALQLREQGWQALVSRSPAARRMEYESQIALSPANAQEVRLYHLFPWLRSRYQSQFNTTHQLMRQLRRRQVWQSMPSALLAVIVAGGLFAWAVWQASQGLRSIGAVVLMIQALAQMHGLVSSLIEDLSILFERSLYFQQYFAFLDARSAVQPPLQPQPLAAHATRSITFEQVSFSYPNGYQALDGVSFHIAAGETIAIVGENGAGKTTLVKLLLRFYDPSAGRILVDGVDLRDLDLLAWRAELGTIFQDFGRYAYTVRENIGLAHLVQLHDTRAIAMAATQAGIQTRIANEPDSYDHMLGKEFGGAELSGGQWQKIAIARALFRPARVLILDEPTAALDPRSEEALYTAFASMTSQRTTFFITHRLNTTRLADRVLVFKAGRLLEDGSHSNLLQQQGEYALLWQMQAAHYQE